MTHPCVNEWCPSKVERMGQRCVACQRSAASTQRLMARVDEKAKKQKVTATAKETA